MVFPLQHITHIAMRYSPFHKSSVEANQIWQQITSAKARIENPKIDYTRKVFYDNTPARIRFTFINGKVHTFYCQEGFQKIQRRVSFLQSGIEMEEMKKELKDEDDENPEEDPDDPDSLSNETMDDILKLFQGKIVGLKYTSQLEEMKRMKEEKKKQKKIQQQQQKAKQKKEGK